MSEENNSPMSPMMKQRWESIFQMKKYKEHYLSGFVHVLKKLYTCESTSDEETVYE